MKLSCLNFMFGDWSVLLGWEKTLALLCWHFLFCVCFIINNWEDFQAVLVHCWRGTLPLSSLPYAHTYGPSLSFLQANCVAAADWKMCLHADWLHFWVWIAFFFRWESCCNCSQANYQSNYERECRLIWIHFTADFRGSADCCISEVTALKCSPK